ncbi:MAG: glycosyltransferase family 2 protein [Phycisphaeraceae bacterium]|nr:glycosyltransferase family 2 protein [Phycisphaeraceae bacterium]
MPNARDASTTPTPNDGLLSIVVPAHNEVENVGPLVEQIDRAVAQKGVAVELIVVDDGSTDGTLEALLEQARVHPWVRVLHRPAARGQSAAMHAGIQAARGRFVATLDADLQNDPADLPVMMGKILQGQADFVQGDRSAHRQDNLVRKVSSWVGRTTRRLLLGDTIRDTGCSTRVMRAEVARQMLLMFKGMHRFMPAYARMLGARVIEMPASHHPRVAGVTKYGILNRGLSGLMDTLAVRWMIRRHRVWDVREVRP